MRALNIKVGDTPGLMEPGNDAYKDSLDDVLDSDFNNTVTSTSDTNPCPLRQSMSATQSKTPFDVLLPSWLFSETANEGDKNSSLSTKRSSSPILLPSIMPREPSNLLLRLSGNYGKPRKGKLRAALTSWGLEDLGYITDQSGSQGAFAVSKSNANGIESSWRNRTQKGSSVVKEQRRDVGSDISQEKLKQNTSMIDNLIYDDSDLILVGS